MRSLKKLQELKSTIEDSYNYSHENYNRFNEFMRMTYEDSRQDANYDLEEKEGVPAVELNVLKVFVNEIIGKYIQQNPSITVSSSKEKNADLVESVEGHIRHIIDSANSDLINCFRESVTGGFSAIEIVHDYVSSTSFEQCIYIEKTYNPTLCYFDKKASTPHKGDGDYCGKIIPMSLDEFRSKFKDKLEKKNDYFYGKNYKSGFGKSSFGQFNWTFILGKIDYVMVCEHYEKVYSQKMLYEVEVLGNKFNFFEDKLKEFMEQLNSQENPPPCTILRKRQTTVFDIHRYLLTENYILESKKTIFPEFPIIFVSGETKTITSVNGGATKEVTIPYVYPIKDIQKIKNMALSVYANDLQNLNQSLAMLPIEAIPDDEVYRRNLLNPQASTLIAYNQYNQNGQPLNKPEPFPRNQSPPQVQQFCFENNLCQNILGNFSQQLSSPSDTLSGKAIIAGDMASHGAATPYLQNFIEGSLSRIGQIFLKLIPLVYKTNQTIPIKNADGTRSYYTWEDKGNGTIKYKEDELDIEIRAGLSSKLQKDDAFNTTLNLMKICPTIQNFICNTKEGINYLLSNVDNKGIESLRKMIDPFIQKNMQQEAMNSKLKQQQIQKNEQSIKAQDPTLLKAQELEIRKQKNMTDAQLKQKEITQKTFLDGAKIANEKYKNDIASEEAITQRMKAETDAGIKVLNVISEKEKMEAEDKRTQESVLDSIDKIMDIET